MAFAEPGAMEGAGAVPKTKKSAKDVIANTTKENTERWLQNVSDEEDTPPPPEPNAVEPTQNLPRSKDEVQDQVMVAEAREEGVILPSDTNGHEEIKEPVTPAVESDEKLELEEIAPPSRSIKLKFTKPPSDVKPTPETRTRHTRGAKRKEPSGSESEGSEEEIVPKKTKTRKGRSAAAKSRVKPESKVTAGPTRSLRSRAPKTQEKEQADRAARARIRAALSEDVEEDGEEMEEV